MNTTRTPAPPRRLVRTVALEADCHERTALRALIYGPDAIHGYALRERLREVIARHAAVTS
jgi:hypothetical protein